MVRLRTIRPVPIRRRNRTRRSSSDVALAPGIRFSTDTGVVVSCEVYSLAEPEAGSTTRQFFATYVQPFTC